MAGRSAVGPTRRRLGGDRHRRVTAASPPAGFQELGQPGLDGVADAGHAGGHGQGRGRLAEVTGLGQPGPEPAGGVRGTARVVPRWIGVVVFHPDTDDEDAGPLGNGRVAGRSHGPARWTAPVTAASRRAAAGPARGWRPRARWPARWRAGAGYSWYWRTASPGLPSARCAW